MSENKLVVLKGSDYGLEETKAQEIQATFTPMLEKMTALEKEYNLIIKKDISEEVCSEAKTLRLKYVKVRTGTADIHKALKDFYLKGGRFVDGWKNAQLMASQGMESALKNIENHYENIEIERIAKLQEERTDLLHKYEPEMNVPNLGEMEEDVWNAYINGVKLNHDQQIRAERKAEKDRIKKENEEIAERERIREENAQLKLEAEERERQEKLEAEKREKAEAERIAREKEEEDARIETARAEAEKREKAEAERIAREKEEEDARIETARAEAEKRNQEEIDRIRLENIEKEKRQSELDREIAEKERLLKAEADRKLEREMELEEKRQAALAPDKDKLLKLADDILHINMPRFSSTAAREVATETTLELAIISNKIRAFGEKL